MRDPSRTRRFLALRVAALTTVLGLLPAVASAGTGAGPEEPVAADELRPSDSTPDGQKSESLQIDPDAVFPPPPPEGVQTLAVPNRLTEPPAFFSGVLRLAPRQAGQYYATEIPMVAVHRLRGRGHPVDFRPAAFGATAGARRSAARSPLAAVPAPALGSPAAPALSSSFDTTTTNTNVTNTGGFLFIPADPIGAAGPNHLVNVVNVTLRFHQKNGALDFDSSLAGFFSVLSPLTFTFDPKVIYDHTSGRFLVVTLEQTDDALGDPADTSRILLAVSDDSDPNGLWFMTAIDSKTLIDGAERWADYPGLAVDEEAIYVTANMFGFAGGAAGFGGVRLWIVAKGEGSGGLYDGGTVTVGVFDPYTVAGIATTTQPAHLFGVAPTGLGTFLVSWGGITDGVNEAVQVVRLDSPLGATSFTQAFVPVGNIDGLLTALPAAPQAKLAGDPTHSIDTNDRRALNAVWFQDSLWMTSTINPKGGDPDAGEATAHWWEIDTTDVAALGLADQGSILGEDLAADSFTYFPSVAVNGAGHAAFGFSASAATTQAGSHYTTHLPTTAAGGNTGSGTLRSGVAYYRRTFACGTVSRWGDYSGMAVDPLDGCFWVYNKHALARGTATTDCSFPADGTPDEDGRWGTAFGKFCPAGACPPDLRIEGTQYSTTVIENAGGQIITSGTVTVEPAADVTFEAGQRIVLADGFNVKAGASFTAVIAPCP
jgi:hypothetical protein